MNHAIMIGPNRVTTARVPRDWMKNKRRRTTIVTGTTKPSEAWVPIARPSTALRTEIAGVIVPSP